MKAKIKRLNKQSWLRIGGMILAAAVALYCVFTLLGNYSDISKLKAEAAQMNTRYEQQLKENEKIEAILSSDNKDEYIEQKAREKGYAKEGEIVFYDISSSK